MIIKRVSIAVYRLLVPVFDPIRMIRGLWHYPRYVYDYLKYKSLSRQGVTAEKVLCSYPCLHDRTASTGFDAHYCYLAHWATNKLFTAYNTGDESIHYDIGGQISWLMAVSAIRPVITIDLRPFESGIETLGTEAGSILKLPFDDGTIMSLSCLHVAEHIGLGRYGDELCITGTWDAIDELTRVMAPNGRVLFAVPIGKSRVEFNAHRVLDPIEIIVRFSRNGFSLHSFSVVDDSKKYTPDANPHDYVAADYACGMFDFIKSTAN